MSGCGGSTLTDPVQSNSLIVPSGVPRANSRVNLCNFSQFGEILPIGYLCTKFS